jgi:hypothetical protein
MILVDANLLLYAENSDFAKFPGLKWRNPVA